MKQEPTPPAAGQAGSAAARWGIAVAAVLLLIYCATLMPGVAATDSGELILSAWLPGIAHAPGFPTYSVLGWLWSHALPLGRVAWRLNLFSAVCAALAGGLAYALALRTLRGTAEAVTTSAAPSAPTAIVPTSAAPSAPTAIVPTSAAPSAPTVAVTADAAAIAAAAAGALALGLGRTVWSWATVAEVYALSLALAAAILLLVVRWTGLPAPRRSARPAVRHIPQAARSGKRRAAARRIPAQETGRQRKASPRDTTRTGDAPSGQPSTLDLQPATHAAAWPLILAAFLFGLGLGAHLTSVALLAPGIAFWLTARRGWRFWISRTALLAALALAAGAAVYLYLPLRAAADPLLNWGRPDTWQRFWWHVTARQYRVSLLSAPVWPQVVIAAKLWWTQFTPVGLALLAVGAWRMARTQRALLGLLALVILFCTLYAWAYVIEDDGDAYYLPAFLAGSVWVAWGAHAILSVDLTGFGKPVRWAAPFVLVAVVVGAALAMNWAASDRRGDTIPQDYVRDTFAEIGANGLLLTRDWQLYSPALYLQQVEGWRPDLAVIDTELLRRGWYFDLLHKLYPDLMAAVAPEARAFLALRDAWERGDIPDGDPRIAQLQAAYVALLDAFIDRAAAAGRPVHAGPNRGAEALRNATLRGQPDMEPGIGAQWQWLPVGLSFRALSPGAQVPAAAPLTWQIAAFGAVQPTAPERKIRATRADMATLRGLLQANLGNLAGAEADWRLALAVDPAHAAARELLNRLKSQQ